MAFCNSNCQQAQLRVTQIRRDYCRPTLLPVIASNRRDHTKAIQRIEQLLYNTLACEGTKLAGK